MRPLAQALYLLFLLGLFLPVVSSCSSTYFEQVAPVRDAYYRGDVTAARGELRALKSDASDDDAAVFRLEEAIVELAIGNPAESEKSLNWSKERLEDVESDELSAFGGDVASYFTDDRFTAYPGEDYEKILIPFFAALANLLGDGQDAVAYSNQVLLVQQRILDHTLPQSNRKHKENYRKIGAGAYLYGLITEDDDPTAGGEVKLSYERVKEWEPQFTAIEEDLKRTSEGVHSQKGNGVLYVFAMVGKGPQKIELQVGDVAFATELTLQFSRLIPAIGRHFGPTLDFSPIKLQHLQARTDNVIDSVGVQVSGQQEAETQTLTDVTKVALQQFNQIRDWVVAKALLRRMVKKAIVTAVKGVAKRAVDKDRRNDNRRNQYRRSVGNRDKEVAMAAIEVGGALINTLWSAAERADTRHWSLLPDKIQVARMELPIGTHQVELTPKLYNGGTGLARKAQVNIADAKNTYLILFLPEPGVGPAPKVSDPLR